MYTMTPTDCCPVTKADLIINCGEFEACTHSMVRHFKCLQIILFLYLQGPR